MSWLKKVKDFGKKAWDLGNQFLGSPAASTAFQLYGGKQGYETSLEGIREQNTTAREIAREANLSEKEIAAEYNRNTLDIANQANVASALQAKRQMDFQERMSNTAHQREISDLRKAGLNPILSGTGGMGSSTPAGAMGAVIAAPQTRAKVHKAQVYNEGAAVSSAMDVVRTVAAAMKANAETNFIREAQTDKTKAEAAKTKSVTMSHAFEQASRVIENSRVGQIQLKDAAETELKHALKNATIAGEKNTKTHTRLLNMQVKQAFAELARMEQDAELYRGEFGTILRILEKITGLNLPNINVRTTRRR